MANGTDSEEFRLVSGARSGLKREFAFALKNHSDFTGSTGRTRGKKSPMPTDFNDDDDITAKRLKTTDDVKLDKLDPVQTDLPHDSTCNDESKPDLVKSVEEHVKSEVPVVIDENVDEQKPLPPLRRFTRSVLKPKEEPVVETSSGGSTVLSEESDDVNSPIKRSSNNRLEMKMSKKIALHRGPSNIKELLTTGFLDGQPVKYLYPSKRDGNIRGIIGKGGILCDCSTCQGKRLISAGEFERHAGSSQKHASDNIYLENGNNLRAVLNACKNGSTESYEESIRNAIADCLEKQKRMCKSCNEPLFDPRKPFCGSCLLSKQSPANSAFTAFTSNVGSSTSGSTPISSSRVPKLPSETKKNGKITRKDQRLHKLVFEEGGLPDGTELAYYVRGQKLIEGYKKGHGIFCFHCDSQVSPSTFEAHAGYAARRKPYLNIYTSNGVSLHELSISLSKSRELSSTDNDDLCTFCHQDGDLLCCDMCPRAFHQGCVDLPEIPSGKWYCSYCLTMIAREKCCAYNANATAAGRVSGVDPIEQIAKRCIRIIDTEDAEVGGCVLCRHRTFNKSDFGPSTVILCDQCEKEYHVGCLKDHKMADLKELPEGKWFCCTECNRIHLALQKLVARGQEKLPDSLLKVIKQKQEADDSNGDSEFDVRWKVLSGKIVTPEDKSLLSKAIAIFHDQFAPIIDSKSGVDYIPAMVYGRNVRDQEFGGMYCAVLTVNSKVVSAGILRVFGQDIVEIPLVATSSDYQGRGYFQALFTCIERLLGFLNVKNIVLPSALESKAIWTDKFGFTLIPRDQLGEYKNNCPLMIFQGTSLLQKPVPKCKIVSKSPAGGS